MKAANCISRRGVQPSDTTCTQSLTGPTRPSTERSKRPGNNESSGHSENETLANGLANLGPERRRSRTRPALCWPISIHAGESLATDHGATGWDNAGGCMIRETRLFIRHPLGTKACGVTVLEETLATTPPPWDCNKPVKPTPVAKTKCSCYVQTLFAAHRLPAT